MTASAKNLTFLAALDAYTALLTGEPRKALRLPCGEAVFLENGQIYSTTVNAAGELDMENAGCISPVAWEDCEDSAEQCAFAVNSPVFIDLDSPGWLEISHSGRRWSFDADQLAEWDEHDKRFEFVLYHRLVAPTVEAVRQFIDNLYVDHHSTGNGS